MVIVFLAGHIEFSGLIRDLGSSCVQYGLELSPDFLMVGKTLMTVEGIARQIYPELDLLTEVEPYFLELLARRYSPEKISSDLFYLATRLGTVASTLPVHAQEILDDMRRGRLSMEVREPTLARAAERLSIHRLCPAGGRRRPGPALPLAPVHAPVVERPARAARAAAHGAEPAQRTG